MAAKKHKKRRHWRVSGKERKKIIGVSAVILLVIAGMVFLRFWESRDVAPVPQEQAGQQDSGYLVYNGNKFELKPVTNYLMIGIDKFASQVSYDSYNNQQQSDFLILLAVDEAEKTVTPIHINRDTVTPIPVLSLTGEVIGTTEQQLALAHTYGSGKEDSCENTALAVSMLLQNVPIHHYLSTTMDAVQIINDAVGGVKVTVEDDFSGIDDTLVQGQQVTLLGEHALHFVRARWGMEDSTNLARMARQRQYLNGLLEQTRTAVAENENLALNSVLEVSPYLISDCTVNQLSTLINDLLSYEVRPMRTLEGAAAIGQEFMEYYVDQEALTDLLVDVFYQVVE